MDKKQIMFFYYKLAEEQQTEITKIEQQIQSVKKNV